MIETNWTHEHIKEVIDFLAAYSYKDKALQKQSKAIAWSRVKEWLETGRWVTRSASPEGGETVEFGDNMFSVAIARQLTRLSLTPNLCASLSKVLDEHGIHWDKAEKRWWAELTTEESRRLLRADDDSVQRERAERQIVRRERKKVRSARAIRMYEKKVQKKASEEMFSSIAAILARNRGD